MRRYVRTRKPRTAHPLITQLFTEMHEQQICMLDMAERCGIAVSTLKAWKSGATPKLPNVADCFEVLGRELWVRYKKEQIDA